MLHNTAGGIDIRITDTPLTIVRTNHPEFDIITLFYRLKYLIGKGSRNCNIPTVISCLSRICLHSFLYDLKFIWDFRLFGTDHHCSVCLFLITPRCLILYILFIRDYRHQFFIMMLIWTELNSTIGIRPDFNINETRMGISHYSKREVFV